MLHHSRHSVCACLCTLIFLLAGGGTSWAVASKETAGIHAVASVPPAGAIAEAIMKGVALPTTLVQGNASPHHFSFRPSQSSALHKATIIFAISPAYEQFMQRSLGVLSKDIPVVWLSDAPGAKHLPTRDEDGHAHSGRDPHLWLTPHNVSAMGRYAAQQLSTRYPDHAEQFHANAENLSARMKTLHADLRDILKQDKGKKFAAYHDGYQYFEQATGIALGAVFSDAVLHQIRPGQLQTIRQQVEEKEVTCLVAEPEFDATVIRRLGKELRIPVIIADPEGMGIKVRGADFFVELLTGMATDFHRCFQPT